MSILGDVVYIDESKQMDLSKVNYCVSNGSSDYGTISNGFCYVNNKRSSGSGSYLKPMDSSGSELLVNWSRSFKLNVQFRVLTNTFSTHEVLFGTYTKDKYWEGTISADFTSSAGAQGETPGLVFLFSTDGTSWTNASEIFYTEIPLDTTKLYNLTYDYNGTQVLVTYTDGVTTITRTIALSAPLYYIASCPLGFGGIARNISMIASDISIDLTNTYIESEGVMVWGCKSN